MSKETIEQKDLIQSGMLGSESLNLWHLSKNKIDSLRKAICEQNYIFGYNLGGRPNGLWITYGAQWLKYTSLINSTQFVPCCYIYEIELTKQPNILHIDSIADLRALDTDVASYWINYDYFTINFVDYLTGRKISSEQQKKFLFDDILKNKKDKNKDIRRALLDLGLIFDSVESARANCSFYGRIGIDAERFRYKDWNDLTEKYDGIAFNYFNKRDPDFMWYIWYQTLDIPCMCIWNTSAVAGHILKYNKANSNDWIVSPANNL